MLRRIKKSIQYRLALLLNPILKPRMLGRKKNFQGRKIIFTSIGNTTYIDHPQNLHISNHTYIGHHNFIEASNGIDIGEGCQITDFISITTHSSHISIRLYGKEKCSNPIGYVKGSIKIGKYTFVGPHSVIMPSTIIGKGSVIQAFSYVKGTFPDFAIIGGNPAKIIGDTRSLDKEYLENNPELRKFYNEWSNENAEDDSK